MNDRSLPFALAIALLLFLPQRDFLVAQQTLPAADQDLAALIQTLKSDGPTMKKAMACQQLAIVGDETAVPVLAKWLADDELSTHARSALENIPGNAADEALRNVCATLEGHALLGVIHSLGKRQNGDSIPTLAEHLDSEDSAVRLAAARAIAEIGTPESVPLLIQAISDAAGDQQLPFGNAGLLCAQRLLERGNPTSSIEMCQGILDSTRLAGVKRNATVQRIGALGDQGNIELQRMLASKDPEEFALALYAARRSPGESSLADELGPMLATQPPDRQVRLLEWLSEQESVRSLTELMQIGDSGNDDVKVAAIKAVGQLGDESCVDWLTELLVAAEPEVVEAAVKAAIAFKGDALNGQVIALLDSTDINTLLAAIEVAAGRRLESAFEPLKQLSQHSSPQVRSQSIHAMGQIATAGQLESLITLMIASEGKPSFDPFNQALMSACLRMPRAFCTRTLAGELGSASQPVQLRLLEQLANVGGPEALDVVLDAAKSRKEAMRDAATRVLGQWLTADAAPAIGKLVESYPPNDKYRTRALRGYIRIARQLSMTMEQRMEVGRNALRLADRNEEKLLALDVLGRHRSFEGLALAQSLINDPALSEKARSVIGQIHKDLGDGPETGFVPLFDGKSLNGWKGGDLSFWRVEDGAIVGGDLVNPVKQNEFLRTTQQFGDFELRLQFKLTGEKANAGVQIRTEEIPNHHEVSGYQADLGNGWWGCLYDESRRNKVLAGPPSDERSQPVRAGQWNDYRILCQGNRIRLWINGIPTVDYSETDEAIPQTGIIAVQVHGGEKMEARYRKIRIKTFD